MAGCLRFDHRQAIHLLQHCLRLSLKDSVRLQRQKKHASGRSISSRLFRIVKVHRLDTGQPSHPSWRPTREASNATSLKSPFSTSDTRDNGIDSLCFAKTDVFQTMFRATSPSQSQAYPKVSSKAKVAPSRSQACPKVMRGSENRRDVQP